MVLFGLPYKENHDSNFSSPVVKNILKKIINKAKGL